MAAQQDGRPRGIGCRAAGLRPLDPGANIGGGKEKFARGPRTGDRAGGGEVVDLALLQPQELGEFPTVRYS